MKYIFFGLIFCFYHFIALGQQSKVDSLLNVLNTAANETTEINTRQYLYQALIDEAERKYEKKEFQQSAQLYEQAIALEVGKNESFDFYNAACSWALTGNKENAFKNLNKAIDNGYIETQWLKNDEDLVILHGEKEWNALLEKLQTKIEQGKANYYWGIYFGILFFLFFYNLFLFFSLKEYSFLYYSLFLFIYANAEITRSAGFGVYLTELFFWIKYVKPVNGFPMFFTCFLAIFYLLFVKDFLYLKQNSIILNKYFKILIIIFITLTISSYLFYLLPRFTLLPLFLIGYVFPFGTGIYLWKKRYKPARFFVLANVFFITGLLWTFLALLRLIEFESKIFIFHPDNIGSVAFFAMLSFALGDKISTLKKEKVEAQEKALEVLEEKVKERTTEVVKQKEIIEEKNKDITDSIRYAQNIQEAILPKEAEIKKALPEHFIYFQPRDIVSGDFYWFTQQNEKTFIAACDCTGHGVPGAFVSMIGNDLLNQIIIDKGLENPGKILTQLNNGVKSVFTREGAEQQAQDGMDMVLCIFDKDLKTLEFAGAKNPLFIIQNGEIKKIRGDSYPIGGETELNYQFNNHKIDLQKGNTIYMLSDGYQDQFGGPKGKKFMSKRLKQLFLDIQEMSMVEQKEYLNKTIEDWKGDGEQVDDILVIGVRV